MAGLTLGELEAFVAATPFAPDLPLAIAVRDGQGNMVELLQGRWPNGSLVAPGQKFYAASLTKQLTGAAIALLCNRGALAPSDRLGHFIPDLPEWVQEVTILQLLGHAGGLPPAGLLEGRLGDADWTTAAAIEALCRAPPPTEPPGRRFSYSNVGYVCLARVVEHVSGENFADFVRGALFEPLGLTGLMMARESEARSFPQAATMGPGLPLSWGDGGLWATASGFARWLACQNEDALDLARQVEAPARLADGTATDYGWGLGLRTFRGQPLFIHGGSWRGARCKAVRSRAFGVAIAVFAGGGAEQDNVGQLIDMLLDAATSMQWSGSAR